MVTQKEHKVYFQADNVNARDGVVRQGSILRTNWETCPSSEILIYIGFRPGNTWEWQRIGGSEGG